MAGVGLRRWLEGFQFGGLPGEGRGRGVSAGARSTSTVDAVRRIRRARTVFSSFPSLYPGLRVFPSSASAGGGHVIPNPSPGPHTSGTAHATIAPESTPPAVPPFVFWRRGSSAVGQEMVAYAAPGGHFSDRHSYGRGGEYSRTRLYGGGAYRARGWSDHREGAEVMRVELLLMALVTLFEVVF